jgi:hypothetical protein
VSFSQAFRTGRDRDHHGRYTDPTSRQRWGLVPISLNSRKQVVRLTSGLVDWDTVWAAAVPALERVTYVRHCQNRAELAGFDCQSGKHIFGEHLYLGKSTADP